MSHLIPDHLTYPWPLWPPVFSLRVMMGTVTQIVAWPKIKTRTNIKVTASYWPVLMIQASDWSSRAQCCPQMATSWCWAVVAMTRAPSLFSVQGPHNTSLVMPHSANRFSLNIAVPDIRCWVDITDNTQLMFSFHSAGRIRVLIYSQSLGIKNLGICYDFSRLWALLVQVWVQSLWSCPVLQTSVRVSPHLQCHHPVTCHPGPSSTMTQTNSLSSSMLQNTHLRYLNCNLNSLTSNIWSASDPS